MTAAVESLYQAIGLSQTYGSTRALIDVSFSMKTGEVHAIIGENGAGKSTLAKVLSGVIRQQSGEVFLAGEPVQFKTPRDAVRAGIATVAQEFQQFPELSIAANIYFQREQLQAGITRSKRMVAGAQAALDRVGLEKDPRDLVNTLTIAEQQLVSIAAALLEQPKVLILDEPTSALQARESARLLEITRGLRARGVAICFISHKLEDVLAIADRITILRDGRAVVAGVERDATDLQYLASELVGADEERSVSPVAPQVEPTPRSSTSRPLRIKGLRARPTLQSIDLEVSPGEIVGLAGLEGSGASAILDAVFGLIPTQGGEVSLPEGKWHPGSPSKSVRSAIARVPSDRQLEGLMTGATLTENITCVSVGVLGRAGVMPRNGIMRARTRDRMAETRIKASGPGAYADSLSGGNQQKVVFAKWIDAEPRLLLLDDPTRGVDIGAREDMHEIIRYVARKGAAVLVTSSDLDELRSLCDRIAVVRAGVIVSEVVGSDASSSRLLELINSDAINARPDSLDPTRADAVTHSH